MGFWKAHMPKGMYLRSDCDWHLDPDGIDTILAYLDEHQLTRADVEPLSLDRYLDYARWFQAQKAIEPWPVVVERLDAAAAGSPRFTATLAEGGTIAAAHVVLAPGFAHFAHVPDELGRRLPADRLRHTGDFVDFSGVAGQRWLIVGGRQSAFEWAALMRESGAAQLHVAHRHDTPAFAVADWDWVGPLVDAMAEDPAWFRRLSHAEQEEVRRHLWSEGRLKLEPWLASRVLRDGITLWPNTTVTASSTRPDGALEVTLTNAMGDHRLAVDGVVLATGYKPDIARVPLLARGNLLPALAVEAGVPVLDEHLQTSVPGLFITSMPATAAFGPFFAFTVSVRVSAKLIGRALTAS
jgi:cation diffusion facilitator CzcD-associated flavoprotein CzcO